ncbi:MAG: NfeD family protein [Promethearchaeati archaeon SRVP18_Atabeyarchaeia-1]
MATKPLVMTIAIGFISVLLFMMLLTLIQYVASVGFHSIFETLPNETIEAFFSSQAFANIILFAIAFTLMIGVLALLTHGAMIKAAKKFVAAYVAFGVLLFVAMGIAGVMIALVLTLISLMLLWQFALKNVVFRTPVAGAEENTGSEGVVVDTIDDEQNGRARVGDTIWWAVSSDGSIIEKGERVRVESTSSDKLTVKVRRIQGRRSKGPQRRCPYCGASSPAEADFCPNCGRSLK